MWRRIRVVFVRRSSGVLGCRQQKDRLYRRAGGISEVRAERQPLVCRSFARGSMHLALWILASRLCSFETLQETGEQTDQRMSKPGALNGFSATVRVGREAPWGPQSPFLVHCRRNSRAAHRARKSVFFCATQCGHHERTDPASGAAVGSPRRAALSGTFAMSNCLHGFRSLGGTLGRTIDRNLRY